MRHTPTLVKQIVPGLISSVMKRVHVQTTTSHVQTNSLASVQPSLTQCVVQTTRPTPTVARSPVLESVWDVMESVHVQTASVLRTTNPSVEFMERHTPTLVKQIVPGKISSVRDHVLVFMIEMMEILFSFCQHLPVLFCYHMK